MKPALSSLVLTFAGFAAGWVAVRAWPQTESGSKAGGHVPPANATLLRPSGATAAPPTSLARWSQARQRAASLTAEEARDLVKSLRHPVPAGESEWWQEVLTRWAESEPQAAADWLREFARGGSVPEKWIAALGPLARRDLRAALTAATRIFYHHSIGPLITMAAEKDPRGTLAFCDANSRFGSLAGPAFGRWLQREPDAALAWLRTSTLIKGESFLNAAIADISAVAPDRLPELIAALPADSDERRWGLSAFAAAEVSRDPEGSLQKFSSLNKEERARMLEPLANYLAHSARPEDVARFLGELTKDEREAALNKLSEGLRDVSADRLLTLLRNPQLSPPEIGQLMESNHRLGPEYAAEFMAVVKQGSLDPSGSGVRNFWARNLEWKPTETIAAMQGLVRSGAVQPGLLVSLAAEMSSSGRTAPFRKMLDALPEGQRAAPEALLALRGALENPAADLTVLSKVTDGAARRDVLSRVFQHMEVSDQRQGLALLLRLPPAQQAEALHFFQLQPAAAQTMAPVIRSLLESAAAPAGDLTTAAIRVAASLPAENGAAMQWLDTLPAGAPRDHARAAALNKWAANDAVAASAWLDAQPPDTPQRDLMVTHLVYRIASTDPERAWTWAGTARDPEARRSLQEKILPIWLATDPAAARAVVPLTNQPPPP